MRKESIYNEVLNMLNDRVDYKSITLTEIANRVGIGKSTIYEYFKSKDEMVFSSIIFYLNKMIKFFAGSFEITTFRMSLKTFIKALIITMKANFWMVMPWTFEDNYAIFLSEQDADNICNLLDKCKQIIYSLFESIMQKGEEEGTLFRPDGTRCKFAFNGLIMSIADIAVPELDVNSEQTQKTIEDLCSCIVKELN